MISERQVARAFEGMWSEVVPLLTPGFVQLFNEAYVLQLRDDDGETLHPIPVDRKCNPSIAAELAFYYARVAQKQSMSLGEDTSIQDKLFAEAEKMAIQAINNYEGAKFGQILSVGEAERSEAIRLIANYRTFFARFDGDQIEFQPRIKGSGFVDACYGDIAIGGSLFEVKTVNRNIAGKDIRQLLVYLALESGTLSRRWSNAGFFNPRRSCFHVFSIDEFVRRIAGGKEPSEVFDELNEHFSSRELQLDSVF